MHIDTHASLIPWLNKIERMHPYTMDFNLSRIRPLAKKLSLTKFNALTILVGGTNGKGSTIRFLEQFFIKMGLRVAATASPHLYSFTERLRIDGKEISPENCIRSFEYIDKEREKTPLTYFEFTTFALLSEIKKQEFDVIILEVGVGGRLDTLNIIDADIAVITSIDFDHMHLLGDTREAIAKEKAGIFRKEQVAICGEPEPPKTLIKEAKNSGANLKLVNIDWETQLKEKTWDFICDNIQFKNLPYPQLPLPNAITALAVITNTDFYHQLEKKDIEEVLNQATLPGRFEILNLTFPIIFDVAHNKQSVQYLSNKLKMKQSDGETHAIFSCLKDKEISDLILPMKEQILSWNVFTLNHPRASQNDQLRTTFKELDFENVSFYSSAEKAYENLSRKMTKQDRGLVYGSFFTLSECHQAIQKDIFFY